MNVNSSASVPRPGVFRPTNRARGFPPSRDICARGVIRDGFESEVGTPVYKDRPNGACNFGRFLGRVKVTSRQLSSRSATEDFE